MTMVEKFQLRIASKRQVTIPQRLLDLLHLRLGDALEVEAGQGEVVAVRALKLMPTTLFTHEVLKKLDERDAHMDQGRYFEIRDLSKLRKRVRAKPRAVSARSR